MKRRYGYGPTGEVLFDHVFDATVTTPSQSEVDMLLPLGDHQYSTRVVLAHDAFDATYVRQSLDYAQFGRVTATLGANGLADATGVVTAFAHHGSLLDAATGLQRKGERWYSPDLGRFVSEDPIQEGANWYAFAGNDPVNYADPSGLSMQGHPLAGGYSGNVTRQPTIKPGNLAASNVFGGPALSPSLNNFIKGAVNQALNPPRADASRTATPVTSSMPVAGFDPARPYREATSKALQQQRQELRDRQVLNSIQKPPTNLFGREDAGRLDAIDSELSMRNPNWLAPPVKDVGPSWNSVSKEQSDMARYRQLASKTLVNNDEEIELGQLQVEYMTGMDYFNLGIGVIGAFAGTPIQQRSAGPMASRVRTSSFALPTTTTPVGQLKTSGLKDAHHVIQNAAVRDLPGYNKKAAPGIQLPGPSTAPGTPHYRATAVQRESGGGTYAAERRIAYKALRYAGYTEPQAKKIIQDVDVYFKGIGVGPTTPTRIPGNRP